MSLPPRWRGPAAIGLFLGLPLLLASLTVANLLRWQEAAAAAARDADRLAQIERRIRGGAAPGAARVDAARVFLDAPTTSLARAELQTRIVALVDGASGRLVEARPEEDGQAADTRSALVRVTFDSTNERLVDLLAAIEAGLPLMSVENLSIRTTQERGGEASEDPTLRVSLAVRAYQREARP